MSQFDLQNNALTSEAEQDKHLWAEYIQTLSGEARREALARYSARYGEIPHLKPTRSIL